MAVAAADFGFAAGRPALGVGKAAQEFGVSPATVRNWVDKGYLRAIRLPSGQRRIPEDEVKRMLGVLFHAPTPTEETKKRRIRATPVEPDEWGTVV